MTSEICQDMVAASEKDALEAPRARGGGGAGGRWGWGEKRGYPSLTPVALRQFVTRHPFIKKASQKTFENEYSDSL